jgi:DNA primase
VTWSELEHGVDPAAFTVVTVPQRLGGLGEDPWHGMLATRQSITAAARRAIGMK